MISTGLPLNLFLMSGITNHRKLDHLDAFIFDIVNKTYDLMKYLQGPML